MNQLNYAHKIVLYAHLISLFLSAACLLTHSFTQLDTLLHIYIYIDVVHVNRSIIIIT